MVDLVLKNLFIDFLTILLLFSGFFKVRANVSLSLRVVLIKDYLLANILSIDYV
jgi:hypothetical protein